MLAAADSQASSTAGIDAGGHTMAAHGMDHSDHSGAHAGHDSSAPAKKEFHFEHCPFCVTHAGSFGLLPVDGSGLPSMGIAPLFPSLFFQSHHPLFAWVTPHSRAPPAFS